MKNSNIGTILKALNEIPGCRAVKNHGSVYTRRGEPDIRGVYRSIAFFIEVKNEREAPRIIQAVELDRWRQSGAVVGVVTSKREALELVQGIRDLAPRGDELRVSG